MNALELLSSLRRRDIELWHEGDRLRYSAPEGAMTAELLAEVARCKEELLVLLRRVRTPAAVVPPLIRARRDGELPLSFPQLRLWFLDRLDPGHAAYNVPGAVELAGAPDLPALTSGLSQVVERHEALRTTFPAAPGGEPVQAVGPPFPISLPVVDLSGLGGLAGEGRTAEARRRASAFAALPFDLARGPLVRAVLFRLAPERHLFAFSFHHTVCDGTSLALFVQELAASYRAALDGRRPALPELPLQYADFAAWQRRWLEGEAGEGLLGYWRQRLAGLAPLSTFPGDRPRPAVASHSGASLPFRLPEEARQGLEARTRRAGTSLFAGLLTLVQALLGRWGGQAEPVVGTPVACRNQPELEPLIGFFANTLVMRADLGDDPSFDQLLARTRESLLADLAHQELPFERLVEALAPDRDLSRNPLFQVMLAFNSSPALAASLPGLEMTPVPVDNGTAKVDLTLYLTLEATDLSGFVEYATELFDATTIRRLVGSFQGLLAAATVEPSRPFSGLSWLAAVESHQLLAAWNDTRWAQAPGDAGEGVAGRIAAQARRAPDAVAVAAGEEALTNRELDARSRCLARRLRASGVGPEVRVGLCLPAGLDQVTAVVACLRSGGAYVPLDPAFPPERLAFVAADASLALAVTDASGAPLLPSAMRRLPAGEALKETAGDDFGEDDLPDREESPAGEELAYVLYTSGSTGRPKGVAVPHRALAGFLAAMARLLGCGPGEALLAVTSLSFDISGLELLLPLTTGGRVVVAHRREAEDGPRLADLVDWTRPARLQATPATWRLLVEAGWVGDRGLTALTGGEALPPDLAGELCRRSRRLWNLYGPTETTVWSTAARVAGGGAPITIGVPIANTRAYVLAAGRLLPVGVWGELALGGTGVARGYLGRPGLTAERFVPDPFAPDSSAHGPGGRLYLTGDRVRFRPDGRLEIAGRLDHQLKVRGFRIEAGEVEGALARHPVVREAAVLAREDRPGDRRLVAWIAWVEAVDPVSPGELRRHLSESLPDYMVPSVFAPLAALPRTPNGKVDRRALAALPSPGAGLGSERAVPVPPRTPTEETLAALWAQVLGVERVGVHDNFFDLGGHSLLATRVRSEVMRRFGVDLPLRQMFQTPTVEGLADYLDAVQWALAGAATGGDDREEGLL